MVRKLLSKYLVPQHSDEEYRMVADYLSAKNEIQKPENFEMIRNFRDWLKAELAQSKKMWVNFHRDYFAKWQILMIKVPCLLSWEYHRDNPFEYKEGFRTVCPFDEDSFYFMEYVNDIPIDVNELPEHWAPPNGMDYCTDTKPERELTENEYLAWVIYTTAKTTLEKVENIVEFALNPKYFCYKQIDDCAKRRDSSGEKLWSSAYHFESSPFKIPKDYITSGVAPDYIRYFQMK